MGTKKWARKLRKMSAEVNFTKRFGLEDGRVFNCRVAEEMFEVCVILPRRNDWERGQTGTVF